MADLIDQFCDAIDEYLRITGDHPSNVAGILMGATGGSRHVKGLGGLSASGLEDRDPKHVSLHDLYGSHTPYQLREWLHRLSNDIGISQYFLVPSVIRFQEKWLTDFLLNREEGIENRKRFIETMEHLISDKQARDEHFALSDRIYPDRPAPDSDEARIEGLKESRDHMSNMSSESPDRTRDKLQTWKDVTRDIASDENIDRYRKSLPVEEIDY